MLLYIYSKCSTCQKAVRFLEKKNVSFSLKEIVISPPSMNELQEMLVHLNGELKKIFNSSGQLYREMNLAEQLKRLSTEEALNLLNRHGMLVKRPFLLGKDFGLVGFKETSWEKRFK